MHITAEDLLQLGVSEAIIAEPPGGAQNDPALTAMQIGDYLAETLPQLLHQPIETLLEQRYEKFRKIGSFSEE
jgi:acetyl-CoA carboxylase carboxyl transferase subunit alpha